MSYVHSNNHLNIKSALGLVTDPFRAELGSFQIPTWGVLELELEFRAEPNGIKLHAYSEILGRLGIQFYCWVGFRPSFMALAAGRSWQVDWQQVAGSGRAFACMLLIEQTTGMHANKQDEKGV
jgi:hypothetical protein